MRDIKFRQFNKHTRQMVGGVMLSGDTRSVIGDEVLMEFTGHYDGKNNPIFEGDLIQFTPETPKKNKTYPLMMVFWNNEKARWSTKIATEGTPEQGFSSITESPERHLVVGNIYENRDLLNG